ncbi:hypothetical protein CRENBAI_018364 [Crenichthys baileyi]|uniref:Prolactin receptor n=1 Tax=Crenichthys baileyi TaxID=28760 RepID=A0AAV9RD20_9TELE
MPAKQKHHSQAKPRFPRATATPHILPYIGRGTVKTTNPKHTPSTRNHPSDKQTPPQYEAEKPDATAEHSDARPAAPTLGAQSRCAKDHPAKLRDVACSSYEHTWYPPGKDILQALHVLSQSSLTPVEVTRGLDFDTSICHRPCEF